MMMVILSKCLRSDVMDTSYPSAVVSVVVP